MNYTAQQIYEQTRGSRRKMVGSYFDEPTPNKHAQALGKLGGKASVKSRFKGMTKKEISEMMRRVRKSSKKSTTSSQDFADCLNLSVLEQLN